MTRSKIYFGLRVPRFQSMVNWLHCCESVVMLSTVAGNVGWHRKEWTVKGPGTMFIFPEHIPSKLFASTRLSFLLLPPYGSMKKLIHLGRQCPQNSAMIRKPQLWMLLYWEPSLWVTSFCGTLHSQTIAGEGDLDVGSSTYRPLTPICNSNNFGWIQVNLIRQE